MIVGGKERDDSDSATCMQLMNCDGNEKLQEQFESEKRKPIVAAAIRDDGAYYTFQK